MFKKYYQEEEGLRIVFNVGVVFCGDRKFVGSIGCLEEVMESVEGAFFKSWVKGGQEGLAEGWGFVFPYFV